MCVLGKGPVRGGFPISNLMLYAHRAVMAVGVGILYNFPILYFVLLAINVSLIHTLKVSDYPVKVSDLCLFHQCT